MKSHLEMMPAALRSPSFADSVHLFRAARLAKVLTARSFTRLLRAIPMSEQRRLYFAIWRPMESKRQPISRRRFVLDHCETFPLSNRLTGIIRNLSVLVTNFDVFHTCFGQGSCEVMFEATSHANVRAEI